MKKIILTCLGVALSFAVIIAIDANAPDFSVGEECMADLDGKWVPAVVLKKENDQYFIHYKNMSSDYDRWMTHYSMCKNDDKSFKCSQRNTREYKLEMEIRYFCEREADDKKIQESARTSYIKRCIEKGKLRASRNEKPDIEPWDKNNPRNWDIHQACIGDSHRFCADKCDKHSSEDCMPLCFEKIDTCKCSYEYDIVSVENCSPGASWNHNASWKWSMPYNAPDNVKYPGTLECMGKYAADTQRCEECAHLRRCVAVCDIDPSSVDNAKTASRCKSLCKQYFPKCKM